MKPWLLLDRAAVEGGAEICLYRRGDEFSIRVAGFELMSSRAHASEDELGRLACERIAKRPSAAVLLGGLGMGFTLAAVLRSLGPAGRVVVAELIPAVERWNRDPLGGLAGHPLRDPRVTVRLIDVARLLERESRAYDAIVLDVDNGPDPLSAPGNRWLYSESGLVRTLEALRPGGVLAVWGAGFDPGFSRRLKRAGFAVEELREARAVLWVATAPGR
ncbi:MAG: hypothetical protein ABI609_14770 [Acidobacteriota bacterium]